MKVGSNNINKLELVTPVVMYSLTIFLLLRKEAFILSVTSRFRIGRQIGWVVEPAVCFQAEFSISLFRGIRAIPNTSTSVSFVLSMLF